MNYVMTETLNFWRHDFDFLELANMIYDLRSMIRSVDALIRILD